MGATKKKPTKERPAMNPEARENQMIALAIDRAEQQLRDGTASSQIITHYLKLGTEKERLETKKLEKEVELVTAKTEALKSEKRLEEVYTKALLAMKKYGGQDVEEESQDESDKND